MSNQCYQNVEDGENAHFCTSSWQGSWVLSMLCRGWSIFPESRLEKRETLFWKKIQDSAGTWTPDLLISIVRHSYHALTCRGNFLATTVSTMFIHKLWQPLTNCNPLEWLSTTLGLSLNANRTAGFTGFTSGFTSGSTAWLSDHRVLQLPGDLINLASNEAL